MKAYLDILEKIMTSQYSVRKETRTGVATRSLSGVQFEHDMRSGFPLLTTKKMGIKSISAELEFFIKGLSDKKWLQERGCTIWDEWAIPWKVNQKLEEWQIKENIFSYPPSTAFQKTLEKTHNLQKEEPDLGRIYGVQWRNWRGTTSTLNYTPGHDGTFYDKIDCIDQLKDVIERAKKNPLDRRLLVTAWQPAELKYMALPPCHYSWEILSDGYYLDLIFVMRSVDVFLGLPYNIASYGILLTLLGLELDLAPRRLVGHLGDTHIYENHFNQVGLQLTREPYELPQIEILNFTNIFDWKYTDIKLHNYQCHEKIEAPIAI